ncbi:hypothetical protein GW17_00003898 [Ensete ventricosum]|nr:hypothetical protein GW17_00003898 [Ensete ventricosum]
MEEDLTATILIKRKEERKENSQLCRRRIGGWQKDLQKNQKTGGGGDVYEIPTIAGNGSSYRGEGAGDGMHGGEGGSIQGGGGGSMHGGGGGGGGEFDGGGGGGELGGGGGGEYDGGSSELGGGGGGE